MNFDQKLGGMIKNILAFILLVIALTAPLQSPCMERHQEPDEVMRSYFGHEPFAQWVQQQKSYLIIPKNISCKLFLLDQKPGWFSRSHDFLANLRSSQTQMIGSPALMIKLLLKGESGGAYCTREETQSNEQVIALIEKIKSNMSSKEMPLNEKLLCAVLLHDKKELEQLLDQGASGNFFEDYSALFAVTNRTSIAWYMADMVLHYETNRGSCDHSRWQEMLCVLLKKRPDLFKETNQHGLSPLLLLKRSHDRFANQSSSSVLTGFEIVQQSEHFTEDVISQLLSKVIT
jgi:hypothetical protein